MRMHSKNRPHEPRPAYFTPAPVYRVADQWTMMQNVFRMWRDFPELRFGEFVDFALEFAHPVGWENGDGPGLTRAGLDTVRDQVLEQACYRFWVHKSGRAIPPDVRERWT